MRAQSSLEWLLVLLAYFSLVAAFSIGFKDFASKANFLERAVGEKRLLGEKCFLEGLFFLNARNAAFPVGSSCEARREDNEPA